MASYSLDSDLIARLVFNLLPKQDKFILSIDRTNWKFGQMNINIFGLDIEKTHIQGIDRIEKLILLVIIAFVWCYKVGIYLHKLNPIKVKKHGRKAKSIFKHGLNYIANALLNTVSQKFIDVTQFLSCT